MSEQSYNLEELSRRMRADPDDRKLLTHYHSHLRRLFPSQVAAKIQDASAWLGASLLEQEAAVAHLAERLHPAFDFLAMTASQLEEARTELPLFRHRPSALEIAICPKPRDQPGIPVLKRGSPFFAQNLPLLDFDGLRARISEAAGWRAIAKGPLSPELSPVESYAALWPRMIGAPDQTPPTLPEASFLVEEVVSRRAKLLRERRQPRCSRPQGRLVLSYLGSTSAAGRAEFASEGFFDSNNLPPWDTWLAWVSGDTLLPTPDGGAAHRTLDYVLALVAPERLRTVIYGVEASFPFVQWVSESPNLLPALLLAEGHR